MTLGSNLNISDGPALVSTPQVAIFAQAIESDDDTLTYTINEGNDISPGSNAASDEVVATVSVPLSSMNSIRRPSRITIGFFNPVLLQERDILVLSNALSIDLSDDDGEVIPVSNLTEPIVITLHVSGNINQANCSFYDFPSKSFDEQRIIIPIIIFPYYCTNTCICTFHYSSGVV